MEMIFLTFLGGVIVGVAIMIIPALSVAHASTWYNIGYYDGYKKGKQETEGK